VNSETESNRELVSLRKKEQAAWTESELHADGTG
jgi:hypothetical protein